MLDTPTFRVMSRANVNPISAAAERKACDAPARYNVLLLQAPSLPTSASASYHLIKVHAGLAKPRIWSVYPRMLQYVSPATSMMTHVSTVSLIVNEEVFLVEGRKTWKLRMHGCHEHEQKRDEASRTCPPAPAPALRDHDGEHGEHAAHSPTPMVFHAVARGAARRIRLPAPAKLPSFGAKHAGAQASTWRLRKLFLRGASPRRHLRPRRSFAFSSGMACVPIGQKAPPWAADLGWCRGLRVARALRAVWRPGMAAVGCLRDAREAGSWPAGRRVALPCAGVLCRAAGRVAVGASRRIKRARVADRAAACRAFPVRGLGMFNCSSHVL